MRHSGLFLGKIAATIFSLKIDFKERIQGLCRCQRSENATGGLKYCHFSLVFEI